MKKSILFLIISLIITSSMAFAAPPPHHRGHRTHAHIHASYHSTPTYIVRSDYSESEQNFLNCKDHYLVTKTTVNFYSNGTRRVYNSHTVYNSDGTVLIPTCSDIMHSMHNNQHYFLVRIGNKYQIFDSQGKTLSKRHYTKMKEIAPNRLLVRVDKKYGVVDLNENKIIPIKYKTFEPINENLFLTKLNGYYGMIDNSNNIILHNKYDKIKRIYDTYLIKESNKYGLTNINGEIILEANNDSIKKLGEYILVKKDKLYTIYDSDGKELSTKAYDKIRLERNVLEGKINKTWEEL